MKEIRNAFWMVLLVLILPISVFAGGGQQGGKASSSGGPTVITINDLTDGFENWIWIKKLEKDLNVKIETVKFDSETFNLAVASGQLPDITRIVGAVQVSPIVNNDIALDLGPLLEKHMPNAQSKQYRPVIEMLKELAGGPSHKLYFFSPWVGMQYTQGGIQNTRGYLPRWDYYKEIGAPPINNDDDYLAVLKAMQARHPTTRSGKKTYAIGVEKNYTDMGGYRAHFLSSVALNPWSFGGTMYSTSLEDNHVVNGYTDIAHSHYWTDMKFYNRVYREGLFDPDSFTMSYDEYLAKVSDGAYMGVYWRESTLFDAESALNPQSTADYISVPSPNAIAFADKLQLFGSFPASGICIPKYSKNWEKALEVLNWLWDPDNNRVYFSGEKGVYWDYDASGKPILFDSTLNFMSTDQARVRREGFNAPLTFNAYTSEGIHPDGYPYNLSMLIENRSRGISTAFKDFSDYYKVRYPAEAAYKLAREGKTIDLGNDYGQFISGLVYSNIPTDTKRIIDTVNEIFNRAMPRLIQAKTDAEFNQIQQQVLSDARAANEAVAWQWISSEYGKVEKIVSPLFREAKQSGLFKVTY